MIVLVTGELGRGVPLRMCTALQIYVLSQDVESLHSFSYIMLSILPAQIIGLLAYGWVGWR